jgi:hypothetical protein
VEGKLNPQLLKAEYAVRGLIATEAEKLAKVDMRFFLLFSFATRFSGVRPLFLLITRSLTGFR